MPPRPRAAGPFRRVVEGECGRNGDGLPLPARPSVLGSVPASPARSVAGPAPREANHERTAGTPSDLAGPGSGGAWRGRPLRVAGAGAGPASTVLVRHRGAQAPGSRQCVRLPHAHLRLPLFRWRRMQPLRPSDALGPTTSCCRSGSVRPATWSSRLPPTVPTTLTLDAMAKIGPTARGVAVVDTGVTDAEFKRLTTRRARHPLQPGAGRRDDGRDARAAVEAGRRPRLACAAPQARDLIVGLRNLKRCRRRSCSTIWGASQATAALSTRPSPPWAADRQGPDLGEALRRLHGHQGRSADLR